MAGQFARVYLLGGPLTRELAETTEFQVALWIAMGLYLPLSLAFWHAPALVHWHRVPPVKSLFFSVVACFKNFGALTVFGLVWIGVFIGAGHRAEPAARRCSWPSARWASARALRRPAAR